MKRNMLLWVVVLLVIWLAGKYYLWGQSENSITDSSLTELKVDLSTPVTSEALQQEHDGCNLGEELWSGRSSFLLTKTNICITYPNIYWVKYMDYKNDPVLEWLSMDRQKNRYIAWPYIHVYTKTSINNYLNACRAEDDDRVYKMCLFATPPIDGFDKQYAIYDDSELVRSNGQTYIYEKVFSPQEWGVYIHKYMAYVWNEPYLITLSMWYLEDDKRDHGILDLFGVMHN